MAIAAGDIKLVASKVMLDVPEGGGGPVAHVIQDGVSNEVFEDISELDRVNGRVNLRQLHVTVQTDDLEIYLGSNVIVEEPPDDPNVDITIFSTGDAFDTRANAVARLEAYLSTGPFYAGFLFGNHIAGMGAISLFQKSPNVPAIGDTLVLTKRETFSDEFSQYVRVTEVSVIEREFEDTVGLYKRYEVVLGLSDTLRADFPGFDVTRYEITTAQLAAKTKLSTTIVANAARYYGVVPLEVAAEIGDFVIKGTSMFTQLVPSAQIETPIADARANQVSLAVIKAGDPVVQSMTSAFTITQSLFIGGAVMPGTLSIERGSVVLTDNGGRLVDGSSQVGTIDYTNGIAALNTNVFGTGSGTHTVTYAPAAVPTAVSQSQGFEITSANRSLSYVRTIEPVPEVGSLNVSYRAQGRWYVLYDDGSGALRGSDSSFGVGMLNRTTGGITLTLGALPDVDSSIIFQWVDPKSEKDNASLTLDNDSKLYLPFNTDGELTLDAGSKAIEPGGLSLTWNDGTARTATDDGDGNLTGDATGYVNYGKGVVRMSPNLLPAPGTPINVALDSTAKESAASAVTDAGSVMAFALAKSGIEPGTVWMTITVPLRFTFNGGATQLWRNVTLVLADLAKNGQLYLVDREGSVVAGDIDYESGTGTLIKNVPISASNARGFVGFDNIYERIYLPPGVRGF
jgi:hypothetical protein